jgi:hypothetical protein
MALTTGWNLRQIIDEIRMITGRPDTNMLSDESIVNTINQYYQYVLPKELKIFWGYTYDTFYTQAGIDHYKADNNYATVNPTITADGWPIDWYIDPDTFYQDFPNQETTKAAVASGDGVINSFSFSCGDFPITQASLYVTDGTQVARSTPGGRFFDSVTGTLLVGTVDFTTATVTNLQFLTPPAANMSIVATYQNYQANRPQAILFYPTSRQRTATQPAIDATNFFIVRPVPDQVYMIKVQALQVPAALGWSSGGNSIVYTDVPFRVDLGPLIALATSLTIFRNANQTDQYNQTLPEYERYKHVAISDTEELYLYQRSIPTF